MSATLDLVIECRNADGNLVASQHGVDNEVLTLPREFPAFEIGQRVEVRLVVEDWTGPNPEEVGR